MSTVTPAPFTCSLETSELANRIRAWQRVAARATSRRLEGDRIVATYPDDERLVQELGDLVAAEATCCAFLEFHLERRDGVIVHELRLPTDMPEETRTGILALVDSITRASNGVDQPATSA